LFGGADSGRREGGNCRFRAELAERAGGSVSHVAARHDVEEGLASLRHAEPTERGNCFESHVNVPVVNEWHERSECPDDALLADGQCCREPHTPIRVFEEACEHGAKLVRTMASRELGGIERGIATHLRDANEVFLEPEHSTFVAQDCTSHEPPHHLHERRSLASHAPRP
jgi:hypothetical protein